MSGWHPSHGSSDLSDDELNYTDVPYVPTPNEWHATDVEDVSILDIEQLLEEVENTRGDLWEREWG